MVVVLSAIVGLVGLLSALCLIWFSRQTYAVDSAAKHGIAVDSSRLGGLGIVISSTAYLILGHFQNIIPHGPHINLICLVMSGGQSL